jgi:hypothetical protein
MTPAVLFLVLAGSLPEGPVPAEIHGRWRVTSEVVDTTPTDERHYKNLVIEIDASTLRLRDGDAVLECTARASANIRSLAITPRTGPKADRPFGGLYFVSNDLLTIALKREPDREVPLSTSPNRHVVVLMLKREK